MIDLSSYAPVEHYRYGVLDVPAGGGSWEAPIREDESSWSVRIAPKLHYHRSGFMSLNATSQLARQAIQAIPPRELGPGHEPCFSFVARHPFAWQLDKRRPSDLVFEPSQAPTTITIAGHIGPLDNLRHESQPENPWAITVEQEDGSLVPTILARLAKGDARYYLWLELHPDRPFGGGDEPALILYGFDPRAAEDVSRPAEMLGVWSVPAAAAAARLA